MIRTGTTPPSRTPTCSEDPDAKDLLEVEALGRAISLDLVLTASTGGALPGKGIFSSVFQRWQAGRPAG